MQRIYCRSVVMTEEEMNEVELRCPAIAKRVKAAYPIDRGNEYYMPKMQVRHGAVVYCPACHSVLKYRDMRVVTRKLSADASEVYFLERCVCSSCKSRGVPAYHTLYPDEVTGRFRYSLRNVEMAIDEYLLEHPADAESAIFARYGAEGDPRSADSAAWDITALCSDTGIPSLDDTDEKTIQSWIRWFLSVRDCLLSSAAPGIDAPEASHGSRPCTPAEHRAADPCIPAAGWLIPACAYLLHTNQIT